MSDKPKGKVTSLGWASDSDPIYTSGISDIVLRGPPTKVDDLLTKLMGVKWPADLREEPSDE